MVIIMGSSDPPEQPESPIFINFSPHLSETLSCAEVNRDHFGGAPTPQSGREVTFSSVSPLSDDFTPGIVFEENFTGIILGIKTNGYTKF